MFHLPPNPQIYLWKRLTPFPLSHVSNNLGSNVQPKHLDQKLSSAKKLSCAICDGSWGRKKSVLLSLYCVCVCMYMCMYMYMYLCVRVVCVCVCVAGGLSQAHGNKSFSLRQR